jgi:hypothetical protein
MAQDVNDIVNALFSSGDRLLKQSQLLGTQLAAQETQAGTLAQSKQTTGDSNYVTTSSLAEALRYQAEADSYVRNVAEAMGAIGPENVILAAAQEMKKSLQEATAASAQVDKVESYSLTNNPLGWIKNQISPDPAYSKYNTAANKYNTLAAGIDSTSKAVQEIDKIAKSAIPATTAAVQATRVEALQNSVMNQNIDAQYTAMKHNAAATQALMNMGLQEYNIRKDMFSAVAEGARLQIARDAAEMAKTKFDEKTDEQTLDEEIVKNYEEGYYILHGRKGTAYSPKQIVALYKSKAAPDIAIYVNKGRSVSGMSSADPLYGAYGYTPAEAAATIVGAKVKLPAPVQEAYTATIGAAHSEVLSDPILKEKYKTSDEKAAYVNARAQELLNMYGSNVDDKNKSNPLLIPSIAELAAPVPGAEKISAHRVVTETKLYRQVFAPLLAAGKLKELNHQEVFDYTLAEIRSGKISPDTAAVELATIFGYGNSLNKVVKQFTRMGLIAPSSYNTKLSVPVFGKHGYYQDIKVNLANEADVKKALLSGISGTALQGLKSIFE